MCEMYMYKLGGFNLPQRPCDQPLGTGRMQPTDGDGTIEVVDNDQCVVAVFGAFYSAVKS